MIYNNSLKLNHHKHNSKELEVLLHKNITDSKIEDWLKEYYKNINEWISSAKTITISTSGTTGKPKQIELKKEWMLYSAAQTCQFFQLNHEHTALLCIPANYIGGKMMIVRAFYAKFNLILTQPTSNPFENLNTPIDFVAITPLQLHYSLETLKNSNLVKTIIVGGGEIPHKLEHETQNLSCDIYATYGMTETSSHIALRRVNGKSRSSYFTVLGETQISTDSRSCLKLRNPNLFEGELCTNDIVEVLDSNKFKWLGRYDNTINTGGVKIQPEEIEKKIAPYIRENLVISSIKDEITGERPVLVLESKDLPPSVQKDLIDKISKLLTKFEIPKKILFIENFPLTPSHKINRKEIRSIIRKTESQ